MKTCPACSETYSERIDFCFNDGEVLVLLPSAMDAPMPRLMTAPPVRGLPREPPRRSATELPRAQEPRPVEARPAEPRQTDRAVGQPDNRAADTHGSEARPAETPHVAEAPAAEAPAAPDPAGTVESRAAEVTSEVHIEAAPAGPTPSTRAADAAAVVATGLAEFPPDAAVQDPYAEAEDEDADEPTVAPQASVALADGRSGGVAPRGQTLIPAFDSSGELEDAASEAVSQAEAAPSTVAPPSVARPEVPKPPPEVKATPTTKAEPRRQTARTDEEKKGSGSSVWILGTVIALLGAAVLLWVASGERKPESPRETTPPRPPAADNRPLPPAAPPTTGPGTLTPPEPAPPAVTPPGAVPGTPPPGVQVPPVDAVPPTVNPNAPKTELVKPPTKVETKVPEPPPPATPAPPEPTSGSPWDAPPAAATGLALITSDPSGATVRIDGKNKGYTPLELSLPYGTYSVELDLDGFVPVRRRIDVQSPAPKFPHPLQRETRTGRVLVVFEGWDSAALEVDGEIRGTLPVTITLSEGLHTFVVRAPDGRSVKLRREVSLAEQGLTRLAL